MTTKLTTAQIKTLTVLARPGVYASHSTMTNAQFYDENNQSRPVCFTISKIAARQGTLEALRIRGLVETTKSGKTRMTESTRYTITPAGIEAITPGAVASTASPALLDASAHIIRLPLLSATPLLPSGNRAIALLPAYCPLALPAETVEIGGVEYRITTHGKIISVEKLVNGVWQHEANYGTPEQVQRFLERMERESNQPAPPPLTPPPRL